MEERRTKKGKMENARASVPKFDLEVKGKVSVAWHQPFALRIKGQGNEFVHITMYSLVNNSCNITAVRLQVERDQMVGYIA
jgi:hypothetical protein